MLAWLAHAADATRAASRQRSVRGAVAVGAAVGATCARVVRELSELFVLVKLVGGERLQWLGATRRVVELALVSMRRLSATRATLATWPLAFHNLESNLNRERRSPASHQIEANVERRRSLEAKIDVVLQLDVRILRVCEHERHDENRR